jgi:hypothetical protein
VLQIGLQGLSFALTVIVIAALKRGGKSIPAPAALAMGIILGYAYAHTGEPWSILSSKAHEMTGRVGDEFGAVPAAVALAIGGWWHYSRPGPLGSVIQGLLLMSAAMASSGLARQASDIIGSLVQVVAG